LPTSRKPARLVVDANAILASVLDEVRTYLPRLADTLGADATLLAFALDLLPLRVYQRVGDARAIREARRQIERRDPDDVDVLALRLGAAPALLRAVAPGLRIIAVT